MMPAISPHHCRVAAAQVPLLVLGLDRHGAAVLDHMDESGVEPSPKSRVKKSSRLLGSMRRAYPRHFPPGLFAILVLVSWPTFEDVMSDRAPWRGGMGQPSASETPRNSSASVAVITPS